MPRTNRKNRKNSSNNTSIMNRPVIPRDFINHKYMNNSRIRKPSLNEIGTLNTGNTISIQDALGYLSNIIEELDDNHKRLTNISNYILLELDNMDSITTFNKYIIGATQSLESTPLLNDIIIPIGLITGNRTQAHDTHAIYAIINKPRQELILIDSLGQQSITDDIASTIFEIFSNASTLPFPQLTFRYFSKYNIQGDLDSCRVMSLLLIDIYIHDGIPPLEIIQPDDQYLYDFFVWTYARTNNKILPLRKPKLRSAPIFYYVYENPILRHGGYDMIFDKLNNPSIPNNPTKPIKRSTNDRKTKEYDIKTETKETREKMSKMIRRNPRKPTSNKMTHNHNLVYISEVRNNLNDIISSMDLKIPVSRSHIKTAKEYFNRLVNINSNINIELNNIENFTTLGKNSIHTILTAYPKFSTFSNLKRDITKKRYIETIQNILRHSQTA